MTCINRFGAFHNHLWDVHVSFALTELIHNMASKRQIFTITAVILRNDKNITRTYFNHCACISCIYWDDVRSSPEVYTLQVTPSVCEKCGTF